MIRATTKQENTKSTIPGTLQFLKVYNKIIFTILIGFYIHD